MKKTILTILQIAVTLGIFAFLFRNPDRNREMLAALKHSDKLWILAGIGVYAVLQGFAIVRWQILLRVQGVVIGWWRAVALVLMGLFFNLLMPGGTGGDVVRIFYLLKEVPSKKPAALLAVLMDRLVGMLGLILFAGVVISIRFQWLTQTKVTSGLLFSLIAIFLASFFGIASSFFLTSSGAVHKLSPNFPFRDKLLDMAAAYTLYGRAWRPTVAAFLLSLPIHFLSYTQFFCAARALPEAAAKAWR